MSCHPSVANSTRISPLSWHRLLSARAEGWRWLPSDALPQAGGSALALVADGSAAPCLSVGVPGCISVPPALPRGLGSCQRRSEGADGCCPLPGGPFGPFCHPRGVVTHTQRSIAFYPGWLASTRGAKPSPAVSSWERRTRAQASPAKGLGK